MADELVLGNRYKDSISEVEGVLTGVAEYLTGCTQGLIEYRNETGTRVADWFDIDRLIDVEAERLQFEVKKAGPGPTPAMSRANR